ncbi:hypothetical protein [Candidatus Nitrospira salsa]
MRSWKNRLNHYKCHKTADEPSTSPPKTGEKLRAWDHKDEKTTMGTFLPATVSIRRHDPTI